MSELEPPRPQDDPDDPLGALFRAGRDVPRERIADVKARLDAPSPAGPGPTIWARVALVGLAVVALGWGGYATLRSPPAPREVAPAIAPPVAPLPLPSVAPPPIAVPEAPVIDEPAPRRARVAPRVEAPEALPEAPVVLPAEAPSEVVAEPAGPTEFVLIARARRMLDRDPESAGRAIEEHARLYPEGLLVEEREALRVEWLFVSGRIAEASTARARFDRVYPTSVHRARIADRLGSP